MLAILDYFLSKSRRTGYTSFCISCCYSFLWSISAFLCSDSSSVTCSTVFSPCFGVCIACLSLLYVVPFLEELHYFFSPSASSSFTSSSWFFFSVSWRCHYISSLIASVSCQEISLNWARFFLFSLIRFIICCRACPNIIPQPSFIICMFYCQPQIHWILTLILHHLAPSGNIETMWI